VVAWLGPGQELWGLAVVVGGACGMGWGWAAPEPAAGAVAGGHLVLLG
jgi:hypothetical protein